MKKNIYLIISLLAVFAFSACENLEVENTNRPTFNETNVVSQVSGTVSGLFNTWFMTATDYNGPGLGLWTTADAGSCSYGNVGMQDLSSEPRVAFNNTPSYSNMILSENYYKGMCSTLSSANDALLAISDRGDEEIEEMERAMAGAYFIQGTTLGALGLLYDQAFVVTNSTDLTAEVSVSPYAEVIDSAVACLDKAIEICENNTFTIPPAWIPLNITMTNVEFGELANTMAARLLTYKSRNATQNEANDWATIKTYAQNGLTYDFEPVMDDVSWYDLLKTYSVYTGWGRIDMRVINMMDPTMDPWFPASGVYTDLPNNGVAVSDDARLLTDFEYLSSQDFYEERGIYHYTTYRYARWDTYLTTWTEPVAYIRKAENDMILAEALVMADNNYSGAAAILNDASNSRKLRGGLPDVAATKDDVLEAIYYEKTIECMLTGENVEFYDMRRRNMLQEGTFLHLPIPAQQLEVMVLDFYTFGGTTGEPSVDYSTGGWETQPGYNKSDYGY